MKSKDTPSTVLLCWMQRLLWVAGAAAIAYCVYTLIQAVITQTRLSRALQEDRQLHEQLSQRRQPVTSDLKQNRKEVRTQMPDAPKNVVGRLSIPKLGLSAMVLEGDDARILRMGLGHIPGTAEPGQRGNIGIAGHRDTFLRPLRHINKGDNVILETAENTYRYQVTSIEIVEPRNVGVLSAHESTELTLVTCYPFSYLGAAPRRFVVHANAQP